MGDDGGDFSPSDNKFALPPPAFVRVIPEIPAYYVDGVWNHIMGPGIAKFHFYRTDAVLGREEGGHTKSEILQVIMPAQSFADMVEFFSHRLRLMVKQGYLTQAAVEERKDFYATYPQE